MSYMRWSTGDWYAYHQSSNSDEKEEQILSLCPVWESNCKTEFTYNELLFAKEKGIDWLFENFNMNCENQTMRLYSGLGLILEFIIDVDKCFKGDRE